MRWATGDPSPTYQWQFNGTNIAGATDSSYTVTNAQFANDGNYSVAVSNSGGTTNSADAVLTVEALPAITTQPSSHTLSPGNTALFSLVGITYGGNGTTNFGLPNLSYLDPHSQGNGSAAPQYIICVSGTFPGES